LLGSVTIGGVTELIKKAGTYTGILNVAQTIKGAADTTLNSMHTHIFTSPLDEQEIDVF